MKSSIKKLPKHSQEEIEALKNLIVESVPKCEMIILFGSYARGTYVTWDERVEFGVKTSYSSDYDIMIVTSADEPYEIEKSLLDIVVLPFDGLFAFCRHPNPSIIVEDIESLNYKLEQQQYFYTEIISTGILLYDTKKYKLSKPKPIDNELVKTLARENYEQYLEMSKEFMIAANNSLSRGKYKMGAFYMHQCCEKLFNTIQLVYTGYKPKEHNLPILIEQVKEYTPDIEHLFSTMEGDDQKIFDALCRAYIEGRYNNNFEISHRYLESMIKIAENLTVIVKNSCDEKLQKL